MVGTFDAKARRLQRLEWAYTNACLGRAMPTRRAFMVRAEMMGIPAAEFDAWEVGKKWRE